MDSRAPRPTATSKTIYHAPSQCEREPANPKTVSPGSPVTLSWSVSNAGYNIVSPQVGVIGGSSVTVVPTKTTIYTLYSTNQYGRTTAKVKVIVK